jgi:DNA-binding MarR family transcriptional regulator
LGITSTQVKTLHYLVDHEGSSQQSVADEMCISRSGASDLLGQMEKKDLVARRLSSIDKRTAEVYLTDSGKAVGAKVKAAYERYCLSCMEDFSAEEIRLFIGLMSRFIRRSHICEDIIEDEPPSGARDADSSLTFRKCSARVLM